MGKQSERLDLTSFSQLVQELIGGATRRHTFSPWELELLFDLQACRIRKSSRADVLRRYLKAVQQQFTKEPSSPLLRLTHFVEREYRKRYRPAEAAAAVGARCAT